jgi:hypothetical protein
MASVATTVRFDLAAASHTHQHHQIAWHPPAWQCSALAPNVLKAICYHNTEPMRLTCAITDSECDEVFAHFDGLIGPLPASPDGEELMKQYDAGQGATKSAVAGRLFAWHACAH